MRRLLVAGAVLAGSCAGCAGGDDGNELTVFAAASLTDAFTAIAERFEAEHPDVDVTFSFAGSQQLVAQIEEGAAADVVATADEESMAALDVRPATFARNRLAIVVEAGNPLRIGTLADLAGGDVTLVLAAPEVPAGRYAAEVLARAGVDVEPRSLEENVRAVVTRIALGEADAGIAYVTDVAAARDVDAVDIPEAQNVDAAYPIAAIEDDEVAETFVAFVLSEAGRDELERFGFLVP